jgi:hypothetical protein
VNQDEASKAAESSAEAASWGVRAVTKPLIGKGIWLRLVRVRAVVTGFPGSTINSRSAGERVREVD